MSVSLADSTFLAPEPAVAEPASIDWATLLTRIHDGDIQAVEELHTVVGRGLMLMLRRILPLDDAGDALHDTFIEVIEAITAGRIDQPAALPAYTRTIARRKASAILDRNRVAATAMRVHEPNTEPHLLSRDKPADGVLIADEQVEITIATLRQLSARDREILHRFYLLEQSAEQICTEMGLTETQFRLSKWRAKQRLAAATERKQRRRIGAMIAQSRRAASLGASSLAS